MRNISNALIVKINLSQGEKEEKYESGVYMGCKYLNVWSR